MKHEHRIELTEEELHKMLEYGITSELGYRDREYIKGLKLERIDFVKYLQSKNLEIDVYGKSNAFNFSNHKGELPYHNKNDGILPLKSN